MPYITLDLPGNMINNNIVVENKKSEGELCWQGDDSMLFRYAAVYSSSCDVGGISVQSGVCCTLRI